MNQSNLIKTVTLGKAWSEQGYIIEASNCYLLNLVYPDYDRQPSQLVATKYPTGWQVKGYGVIFEGKEANDLQKRFKFPANPNLLLLKKKRAVKKLFKLLDRAGYPSVIPQKLWRSL